MSVVYVACSIFERPEHRFEESLRVAQCNSKHTFLTGPMGGLSPGSHEKFMGLCALRNGLMSTFLRFKQADYFFLVDADLNIYDHSRDNNIFDKMIEWDVDFVTGLYAPRVSMPNQVHASCPMEKADINPRFARKLIPMRWAAGGCWMIKRAAIEKVRDMIDADLSYEEGGHTFWGFFNELVVTLPSGKRKFLTEDYSCCQRFTEAGISIYADTSILLGHIGATEFRIWNTPQHLGGNMGVCNIDEGALRYLQNIYGIKSMMDVGCGLGLMRDVAKKLNIEWLGIDGDPCVDQQDMIHMDLRDGPIVPPRPCYLAWCVEMVEHVDEQYADNIIRTLAQSPIVCLTHALPGQAGHHHVNCQPPEYWIAKLEEAGYLLDEEGTKGLRSASTMKQDYMRKTGMVFTRNFGA